MRGGEQALKAISSIRVKVYELLKWGLFIVIP